MGTDSAPLVASERSPLKQASSESLRSTRAAAAAATATTTKATISIPATATANIIFGSTTLSPSRARRRSGLVVKASLGLLVVSWSAIAFALWENGSSSSPFLRSSPSILGAKTTTLTTDLSNSDGSDPRTNKKDGPMKLSLWLVPPGNTDGDSVYARTKTVIDELSADLGGPEFLPHVTVVGGIKVDSEAEAHTLAQDLRTGLSGFGPVDCSFGDSVRSAPDCWNQALVLELVHPSEKFLDLCKTSRTILGMEQDPLVFPPPLGVPHMSLYYGDSPLPLPTKDYISEIFGDTRNGSGDHTQHPFKAHRVVLWKTDPSSTDGVPEWEPLADISLL